MNHKHIRTLVLIKGAGDLATGVAVRLLRTGFKVVMTDIEKPSAVRRTVAFSEAVYHGRAEVEGFQAKRAYTVDDVYGMLAEGTTPVLADATAACTAALSPDVLVDAIIAKRNLGTAITDAALVIALGPGFIVGKDCHAAIETMRGHDLGRVYYMDGQSPIPNTGVPGLVAGFGAERVMYTPCAGVFHCLRRIGDAVNEGDIVAEVDGAPVKASIPGILRGLLPEGFTAWPGLKCADIDPRCKREHCFSVSDKARAIGGGVLEAILAQKVLRRTAGDAISPRI